MSKVIIQKKGQKIKIINKLTYPESVNERVFNALGGGMFDSFLPLTIKQKRKETILECNIVGLITLEQYFVGVISKNLFLDFVYQLVQMIKNCEKGMASPNNIDLKPDRVFIDPLTKKIRCVFWPVVNNQCGEPANIFLKELPYLIKFSQYEDSKYLEEYAAFFNGIRPFSINAFEKLIMYLMGKESVSSHASSASLQNHRSERSSFSERQPAMNPHIAYNPFENLADENKTIPQQMPSAPAAFFCSSCGQKNVSGARFCAFCGFQLSSPSVSLEKNVSQQGAVSQDSGTMLLGESPSGGTVVLGYDTPQPKILPVLKRVRTNVQIKIEKDDFRIGQSETDDWYIHDNQYISHGHASILTENNRYFVMDHHSRNRTFVNGRVIEPDIKIELFNGYTIRLANEDFEFSLTFV